MHIDYYFDFSCPFAYLGSLDIEAVARRNGATLTFRPMLLGGVFRALGYEKRDIQAKQRHDFLDMSRWAELRGAVIAKPGSPPRTVRALRAVLAVAPGHRPALIHAIYRAHWVEHEAIDTREVLRRCLTEAGVLGSAADRALAANDDPTIKTELRTATDLALAKGAFGAPWIVVSDDAGNEHSFWGQDRMEHVEAVLRGWRPASGQPPQVDQRTEPGATWGQLPALHDNNAVTEPATIEFWYDFSSPFSYLASTQIRHIAASAGATLIWCPMLLGAVFKQIGSPNVPMHAMPEPKQRWVDSDLALWAAWWGVPFVFASRFPQRTVTALRLALAAGDRIGELTDALYRAIWVENQSLEDVQVLRRVLLQLDFDADAMLEATETPQIKQQLFDNTARAVARGVFGAPTFIVRRGDAGRLFWGQDRLELVARSAAGITPPSM